MCFSHKSLFGVNLASNVAMWEVVKPLRVGARRRRSGYMLPSKEINAYLIVY